MNEQVETVIIGAGHAGLTMSYYLRQLGREHVILDRGRVAERWRSERWDSFFFQFPNWTIELPGYKYKCDNPDEFVPGREIVRFVEDYAQLIEAPLRCGVEVNSLRPLDGGRYLVQTATSAIEATNVVIATGPYQRPSIPPISAGVPNDIFQIHSSRYRNSNQLPPGAVLVVGGGSSGCQIAEDLNRSGRQVYLSVGRHLRVPRHYRGRDYGYWRFVMGGWDRTVDSLPAGAKNLPTPLLTGFNGGHDVDFRRMAAEGIVLAGHLETIRDGTLIHAADLEENLAKGDEWFTDFKRSVDEYVTETDLDAPEEKLPGQNIATSKEVSHPVLDVNLRGAGITSIVWASGFRYDFSWIEVPVCDETGAPVHRRGVAASYGIYFLGLKWLYKMKSAFLSIAGCAEDAAYLAEVMTAGRKQG
jgi:putative flavoprotein involved in K+ transport